MPRRYDADRALIAKAVAGKGAFKVRYPDAGRHVEADISRQVLALIDGGEVAATYHTSSGAPATPTIIGSFRVYRKDPGTNALGMYKSSYFIRGYAIHGYVDVPAFNASHGCLRVALPDAPQIYDWVQMGDRVITYP
jgi:lipoprotein-anchoring transpeptidase ErfK/SrfK